MRPGRLACNRCTHPLSPAMQEEEGPRGMEDLGYWIHLDPDPPFLMEDSESWVKDPGFMGRQDLLSKGRTRYTMRSGAVPCLTGQLLPNSA